MNISGSDQRTIERALEVATRCVSTEDGKDFRELLQKLRASELNASKLDGIRYDYTDNF